MAANNQNPANSNCIEKVSCGNRIEWHKRPAIVNAVYNAEVNIFVYTVTHDKVIA